jgi:hypothetical protein
VEAEVMFLLGLYLLPVMVLVFEYFDTLGISSQALESVSYTVLNSSLSAVALVILAFLSMVSNFRSGVITKFSVALSFMPSVFLVAPFCELSELFGRGMSVHILANIVTNFGLSLVWAEGSRSQKLESEVKMADIYAISLRQKSRMYWSHQKGSLVQLFVVLFSLNVSNLTYPLFLAGEDTVETYVYSVVLNSLDVGSAVGLGVLQMFSLVVLSLVSLKLFGKKRTHSIENRRVSRTKSVGVSVFDSLSFFACAFVLGFMVWRVIKGADKLGDLAIAFPLEPLLHTMTYFVSVFFWATVLQILFVLCTPGKRVRTVWATIIPPSSALLGLVFARVLGLSESLASILFPFLFALMLLPTLLRFGLLRSVDLLSKEKAMAKTLGELGNWRVFTILLSGATPSIISGALLAGIWSLGEYSLARVVGAAPNLAMYLEDMLANYRFTEGAVVSLYMFLLTGMAVLLLGFGDMKNVKDN